VIPKPLVVFLGTLVCFLGVLTVANRQLFRQKIYEDGDAAANSILIQEAKHFRLLVGNYSRMRFNHPGPGILYVLAFAEITFHDWLGVVPAPHNAHMLGTLCLNAFLLALTLAILAAHWKSWLAVVASVAVFLGYFGWSGFLGSHWFPAIYFAIFLTFCVAAASVAAGRVGDLPYLGLAGSFAIHGHVCFVIFVVPIALVALGAVVVRTRFQKRRLFVDYPWAWIGLGLVVSVFILPMVLHTTLNYPGEIGKYVEYARSNQAGGHGWAPSLAFAVRCLTSEAAHPIRLALALVLAAIPNLFRWLSGSQAVISRALISVCLLATGCFWYYAARGVDDLQWTYVGMFYGAVFLIGATTVAMNLAVRWSQSPAYAGGVMVTAGLIAGYSLALGAFKNSYPGDPAIPAFIDALEREAPGDTRPVLISFHPQAQVWPTVAGFVVEMDRRGRPVYLADSDDWIYMFTKRFAKVPNSLFHQPLRRLDFALPGSASARVLGQTDKVVLQEFKASYRLGSEIVFDAKAHPFTLRGWSGGNSTSQWTVGSEAILALDVGPVVHDVELTAEVVGFATENHPQTNVNVIVNNRVIDHWVFHAGENWGERRVLLSSELIDRQPSLVIVFETPDACSPLELGLSSDPRRLAMMVHRMRLSEVAAR
jgi:hypothetical protein